MRTARAAAIAVLVFAAPLACATPPVFADGARPLLPQSTDFTLPNGMHVILVPDHEIPLVSFRMRFAGGSVEDPAGKEGTAALLASLLSKGAGDRDAAQFADDVEFAGGTFSAGAAVRWTSVSCEFLKGDVDLALEILGDVALRPRLDAAEFAKERGLALDSITSEREEPQAVIGRYATTWFFGQHAFGRPSSGDENSVAALTLDDVRAAAKRQLAPQRAWLAVAGDIDPADLRKRIEARFGAWKSDSAPAAPVAAWAGTDGGRVLLVDKPDSLQTYFWFGNRGFDLRDALAHHRHVGDVTAQVERRSLVRFAGPRQPFDESVRGRDSPTARTRGSTTTARVCSSSRPTPRPRAARSASPWPSSSTASSPRRASRRRNSTRRAST